MSEEKFTPGAWSADETQGSMQRAIWGISSASGKTVAEVANSMAAARHSSDEEIDANAHLIVAAPEMYAALKFYMDIMPLVAPAIDPLPGLRALAKARGE